MDPGLIHLAKVIGDFLASGHVWWQLPLVITMAYTLLERERLLDNALFDSYPNPLPQVKMRCNDPVLGWLPVWTHTSQTQTATMFVYLILINKDFSSSSFVSPFYS